ncbi:C4-dicarboxylate ABC transporter [Gammaproteobacteria bacterium]|nr:C4-dicarboxylate ABC transporter [Gammaproteobacteria bacterium]
MSNQFKIFMSTTLLSISYSLTSYAVAEPITLKISHFLPAESPAQKQVFEPWCAKIKKDSGGQLLCAIYPAMSLEAGRSSDEIFEQIKRGKADIGWVLPNMIPGNFPIFEAIELPFMIKDSLSSSLALWNFYETHAQDEFTAFADFKVLAFFAGGGTEIHTKDKKIETLADLKGLKLNVAGKYVRNTMSTFDVISLTTKGPDHIIEQITNNVTAGVVISWQVAQAVNLNSLTKFHTQMPEGKNYLGAASFSILMNKDKYNSLSDDLKKVIDQNSGLPLVTQAAKVWDAEVLKNKGSAKREGHTMTTFSDIEYEKLLNLSIPLRQKWIDKMTKAGKDGEGLFEALNSLLDN